METLKTLYNLLQINRKIEDQKIRFLYLKDVWGIDQNTIAELEDVSQSLVSRNILTIRKTVSRETLQELTHNLFTAEEIQYVQMLPREILPDMTCLAFIQDILGISPIHPFFQYYDTSENVRMAALASLGVQNKRLVALYKKNQPTVSMVVIRNKERVLKMERPNRYERVEHYKFQIKHQTFQFRKAGGIK